ncbi:putative SET domain protein [Plasmodium gaboni]|uniref:Putative SET domain protein n=1 Tax=Plasmodium gaboni TaxID=647221 RepID=A0A151LU91_9APIC|nr:putative SET domain protein [Plasmodium gaboni]KYO02746.1 putative SET domain protein [Plasmodium gaboni]
MNSMTLYHENFKNINSFLNSASVIWIEKEKLDSIIYIPLYTDIFQYIENFIEQPEKKENKNVLTKIYLLFDDDTYNIAVDISPLCNEQINKIPLLIYKSYYFWHLQFFFEKFKIKRQKLILNPLENLKDIINKNRTYDYVYMYRSIYSCANNNFERHSKNERILKNHNKEIKQEINQNVTKKYFPYKDNSSLHLSLQNNNIKKNNKLYNDINMNNKEPNWCPLTVNIENMQKKFKKTNENNKHKNSKILNNANMMTHLLNSYGMPPNHFKKDNNKNNNLNNISQNEEKIHYESYNKELTKIKPSLCDDYEILSTDNDSTSIKVDKKHQHYNIPHVSHMCYTTNRCGRSPKCEGSKKSYPPNNSRVYNRPHLKKRREKKKKWYYYDDSSSNDNNNNNNINDDNNDCDNNVYDEEESTEEEEDNNDDENDNNNNNNNNNMYKYDSLSTLDESYKNKKRKTNTYNSYSYNNTKKHKVEDPMNVCYNISNDNQNIIEKKKEENLEYDNISYNNPGCIQNINNHQLKNECEKKMEILEMDECNYNDNYIDNNNNNSNINEMYSYNGSEQMCNKLKKEPIHTYDTIKNKKEKKNCFRSHKILRSSIISSDSKKMNPFDPIHIFKNMFCKNKKQNPQFNHSDMFYTYQHNDSMDKYVNKILKNIINKEKSPLNNLSKNYQRIEALYNKKYKIFISDSKQIINGRTYFKNNKNEYILSNYEKEMGLYEFFEKYLKKDVEKVDNEKGQSDKPSDQNIEGIYNSTQKHFLEIQKRQEHDSVNELVGIINVEEQDIKNDKRYNQDDIVCLSDDQNYVHEENDVICIDNNNNNNNNSSNIYNNNNNNSNNIYNNNNNNSNNIYNNNHIYNNEGVLFYAYNKENKNLIKLKEGDNLYIKFCSSSNDYDKIKILKQETILFILIYIMQNKEKPTLSDICNFSPDLFWNMCLYFKDNIMNIDPDLVKIHKFLSTDKGEENGYHRYSSKRINYCEKRKRRKNKEPMEIMKLKDNVAFLDKFLQSINEKKLNKLKEIQSQNFENYELHRNINSLNKQQLINLFIDKEYEINLIPLTLLKEKCRNIIYEENLKMNMCACIRVIFDNIKGRCIYAASNMYKLDFICEYVGDVLTYNEAMKREEKYKRNTKKGCFMFYFKYDNKIYCVDSTKESVIDTEINNNKKKKKKLLKSFARLVNHSKKKSNLIPKVLKVDNNPRLFFVASRDIKEGEELLIDYGERDKEIIKDNQWLKF